MFCVTCFRLPNPLFYKAYVEDHLSEQNYVLAAKMINASKVLQGAVWIKE